MVEGNKTCSKRNGTNLLLVLRGRQTKFTEQSSPWLDLQRQIDRIVAQNYLEWVNR